MAYSIRSLCVGCTVTVFSVRRCDLCPPLGGRYSGPAAAIHARGHDPKEGSKCIRNCFWSFFGFSS